MKGWKIMLLALCLALAALVPSALSEVVYDAAQDMLTVRCDACTAGDDYALMILRDGANAAALSNGDVLFIDQLTADESGIEAAFVHPTFPASVAVAGGAFADGGASPRTLGRYAPDSAAEQPFHAPAMLRVIGDEAFEGSAFTHVYLAEGVTEIGARAFANCKRLVYIYIPAETSKIADDAFEGCGSITIGCRAGSAAQSYAAAKGYTCKLIED